MIKQPIGKECTHVSGLLGDVGFVVVGACEDCMLRVVERGTAGVGAKPRGARRKEDTATTRGRR
jgi:hypothetical protein